ncbi:MAG: ABC transporter permease [Candidatus Bathyarchaeia archaeon]
MLKGFGNFLFKELKELVRDPKILLGMIIVPLLMFPVLGGVMSYAMHTAKESVVKASLVVVNNDGEEWSYQFIRFLSVSGVRVLTENNVELSSSKVTELFSKYNTTQVLEIPQGFSRNVSLHANDPTVKASVKLYGLLTSANVFESVGSSLIDALVSQFNRALAPDVLYTEKSAVIKGEVKRGVDPAAVSGLMMAQSIALPITIMILLTYSIQIAATSVAIEKEEKTLETLLTLPMNRLAILFGKLSSSIIVAAVGALAYMMGYSYLIGSLISGSLSETALDLASLGLVPSVFGYLLLGISLFVTMLSALALAVVLSAFAEDVRSAQSFIGYIYPFIFLPAFALMYIDINTLPYAVRIIFYAIPYSHPIIASKAVVMGDNLTAILGIIYVSAFTIFVMYLASRLFATEKILTAKLKFKGLRKSSRKPIDNF